MDNERRELTPDEENAKEEFATFIQGQINKRVPREILSTFMIVTLTEIAFSCINHLEAYENMLEEFSGYYQHFLNREKNHE